MTCYEFEATRYVRGRHFSECDGAEGCAGCLRCPESHCGECRKGTHLGFGEHTCPECVGKVRATLRSLLELYAALPAEAVVRGATSEAANLYGPATDAEAWSYRKAARSLRLGVPMSTLEDDDTNHPVFVLDGWIRALGEDYADHPDRQLTLSEAVDWIDKRLGRIANDVGQDFGQFRREVNHCRVHMESVLHDGEQVERGVPCPTCRRLIEQDGSSDKAPRLRLERRDTDRTGASDRWQCPDDRDHWWSEADYRLRVGTDYIKHAAALTASDMQRAHGVKPGSVTGWAAMTPPKVRKMGKDHNGRQLYSVADVLVLVPRNAQSA